MQIITGWIDGNFAFAFGWTLVHSLWQCALIAVALRLAFSALGSARAELRCLAGMIALSLCWLISAMTFARYYSAAEQAVAIVEGVAIVESAAIAPLWQHEVSGLAAIVNRYAGGLVLCWALGFGFCAWRYAGDYRRAARLTREGVAPVPTPWRARFEGLTRQLRLPAATCIKLSHHVTGACVIGHFKPTILLPVSLLTHLSAAEVEALVLHEMAHIKRRDYLINALQCCGRAVYFFNPAVYWISRQLDRERENACDDLAVSICGDRAMYAHSLAKAAQLELNSVALLAARSSRFALLPRIKRLWTTPERTPRSRLPLLTGAGMLLLSVAVNVGALDVKSAKSQPTNADTSVITDLSGNVSNPTAPFITTETIATETIDTETSNTTPAYSTPTVSLNKPATAAPIAAAAIPKFSAIRQPTPLTQALAYAQAVAAEAENLPRPVAMRTAPVARVELALQGPAGAAPAQPALEPIASPYFNEVLISSAVKLPTARKIYIADVVAEFAPVWLDRFQSRTSAAQRRDILKDYRRAFRKRLETALADSGWQVVAKPQADALQLQPRLIDIYIAEPDSGGSKQTLVAIAGQAGMELSFIAPDSTPFLKITDHRNTRTLDTEAMLANRANNFRYFDLLMNDWSKASAAFLDQIMNIVEQQRQQTG